MIKGRLTAWIWGLLLCSLTGMAQEQKEGYYPGGALRYRGSFKDGKPVGEVVHYGPEGKVKARMNHRGAETDAVLYAGGGEYFSSGRFLNRKKEGVWEYRKGDRLLAKENYRDGLLDGVACRYFVSGQVAEEKTWKGGVADGVWRLFYESGQQRMAGVFSGGRLSGVVESYDNAGVLRTKGAYSADLKEGEWLFYDAGGKLVAKKIFHRGMTEDEDADILKESRRLDAMLQEAKRIPDPEVFADDPEAYMKISGQ